MSVSGVQVKVLVAFGLLGFLSYSYFDKLSQRQPHDIVQVECPLPLVPKKIGKTEAKDILMSDAEETSLEHLLVTVKTCYNNRLKRLQVTTETWLNIAQNQTWFITDRKDEEFSNKTGIGKECKMFSACSRFALTLKVGI